MFALRLFLIVGIFSTLFVGQDAEAGRRRRCECRCRTQVVVTWTCCEVDSCPTNSWPTNEFPTQSWPTNEIPNSTPTTPTPSFPTNEFPSTTPPVPVQPRLNEAPKAPYSPPVKRANWLDHGHHFQEVNGKLYTRLTNGAFQPLSRDSQNRLVPDGAHWPEQWIQQVNQTFNNYVAGFQQLSYAPDFYRDVRDPHNVRLVYRDGDRFIPVVVGTDKKFTTSDSFTVSPELKSSMHDKTIAMYTALRAKNETSYALVKPRLEAHKASWISEIESPITSLPPVAVETAPTSTPDIVEAPVARHSSEKPALPSLPSTSSVPSELEVPKREGGPVVNGSVRQHTTEETDLIPLEAPKAGEIVPELPPAVPVTKRASAETTSDKSAFEVVQANFDKLPKHPDQDKLLAFFGNQQTLNLEGKCHGSDKSESNMVFVMSRGQMATWQGAFAGYQALPYLFLPGYRLTSFSTAFVMNLLREQRLAQRELFVGLVKYEANQREDVLGGYSRLDGRGETSTFTSNVGSQSYELRLDEGRSKILACDNGSKPTCCEFKTVDRYTANK